MRAGPSALSRRTFVERLATGLATVCAVGMGASKVAARERLAAPESLPELLPSTGADASLSAPRTEVAADAAVATVPAELPSAPPWELLRPLKEGAAVGHGWRVSGLTPVVHGACVLTLENARGRTQRVHLCANTGRPQGLVYTRRFDLVVMNGGQGDLPTEEGLAQAVAQVAHVLAANERRTDVAALLPHVERVERFASAAALR